MATATATTTSHRPSHHESELPRPGFVPPDRNLTQRLDALRRANDIRMRRSRLKRDLKAGREQLAPLLLDPPDYLLTAKLWDLLLAVPRLGRVKVNHLLRCKHISPSKTVGGLSERQRQEIVAHLRSRERRP